VRVLVACEESQAVTKEFRRLGHEAYSCDILDCSGGHPEWHIMQDVTELLKEQWDMVIAFPPCTYLCSSGMHWTTRGLRDPQLTEDAAEFFMLFADLDIPYAVENPIGTMSKRFRRPDQIIQPWQFGDDASKRTCLWLNNLPKLKDTDYVWPRIVKGKKLWANQTDSGQNKLTPSEDRARLRSKTYPGIAKAMAEQWSSFMEGEVEIG
jgi:hypothetical protein